MNNTAAAVTEIVEPWLFGDAAGSRITYVVVILLDLIC